MSGHGPRNATVLANGNRATFVLAEIIAHVQYQVSVVQFHDLAFVHPGPDNAFASVPRVAMVIAEDHVGTKFRIVVNIVDMHVSIVAYVWTKGTVAAGNY